MNEVFDKDDQNTIKIIGGAAGGFAALTAALIVIAVLIA